MFAFSFTTIHPKTFLMAVEMDKYKHYNLVVPILSFCFGESFGPFTTR